MLAIGYTISVYQRTPGSGDCDGKQAYVLKVGSQLRVTMWNNIFLETEWKRVSFYKITNKSIKDFFGLQFNREMVLYKTNFTDKLCS